MYDWIKPSQYWTDAVQASCCHDSGCHLSRNPLPRYNEWPTQAEYTALHSARAGLDKRGPGGRWNLPEGEKPLRGLRSKYHAAPVSGEQHAGGPITACVARTKTGYRSGLYCGLCQKLGHCGFFKVYDGVPFIRTRVRFIEQWLPDQHVYLRRRI